MEEIPELFTHLGDLIQQLFGLLGIVRERFTTNVSQSFAMMDAQKWIRLIAVVGAYLLLRPYILKIGGKQQAKQLQKESDEAEAEITANELRGHIGIPDASDDDEPVEAEATAASTATEWGKKARKRQRNMLKKMIDEEEARLQELQDDEEDKDIEQYLVG